MSEQNTPKPLTAEEVDDALTAEYAYTDKTIQRLWAELLASRAESAALRAERDAHLQAYVDTSHDRAALAAELAEARKVVERLVEAGSKAADDLARVGEFHTAGAWLWSSLDRSRPEFEEAEWRRARSAEVSDDLWKVLHPLIPDDETARDSGRASGGGADAR